jgi:tetratricopeptide (TPR) repeat protein
MGSIRKGLITLATGVAILAIIGGATGNQAAAQDNEIALQTVLSRYAGATRNSPTVDEELARRLFRRGNTYSNLERYEDAIAEFEQCIAADPNFAEGYRNLANTYYYLQRFQQAKPHYARFIALTLNEQPNTAIRAAVSTMGQMERQDGNFEEAIAFDLRAIELDPGNDSQVHIMGNTYNNAGDPDKAILIYQAGIENQPDNAFFYRTLGRLLEQEDRLEEALAQYEIAAQRDPESDFYANLVENMRARLDR